MEKLTKLPEDFRGEVIIEERGVGFKEQDNKLTITMWLHGGSPIEIGRITEEEVLNITKKEVNQQIQEVWSKNEKAKWKELSNKEKEELKLDFAKRVLKRKVEAMLNIQLSKLCDNVYEGVKKLNKTQQNNSCVKVGILG